MCIAVHILLYSQLFSPLNREYKAFILGLLFQAFVDVNLIRFDVDFFVDGAVAAIVVSMSKHKL